MPGPPPDQTDPEIPAKMEAKNSDRYAVRNILGIPLWSVTLKQALDLIHEAITEKNFIQIGVVNAAKIVTMNKDPRLKEAVLSSDMIFADGISVVWASKVLNRPLPERVTGIDLMMGMLEKGNTHGYRIFCLGATEEVSRKVAEHIKRDYPGIRLVGRHHGYYQEEEEREIAQRIAAVRPEILLVAMTSPKKEQFMEKWGDQLNVSICHGVGGSFDVFAGKVDRAPERWQRLGLEWLYRLKQEPRRLWRRYLVTNIAFCGLVFSEFLRKPRG
jgi:N-acetylglucosaminyldiphosphoundecaprenol N-acetyl-beta-D-mannosaminyltransferase